MSTEEPTDTFALQHDAFLDEYATWDRLVSSITDPSEEGDLTPTQRQSALDAVGYLRHRFGENWLREAFARGHPFIDLVGNRAPWTRVRIADLADAIQQVEGLPLGRRTVDRYMAPDQQAGAVFELDLVVAALRKGLIVDLEPATQPGRKCDLAVTTDGAACATKVFVEVQTIQDFADTAKRDMAVIERLAPTMRWLGLDRELLGAIYRTPSDDELPALQEITEAFWRRCERSTEPEHLQVETVIDVWAVPHNHPSRADLIGAGVPEHFSGPVEDDPLRRTLRAIRAKIGQLPVDAPGLIVLRPPALLFLHPHALPVVVSAISKAIEDAPQISGVALVGWAFKSATGPPQSRLRIHGAVIIHEPDRHIFMRQVVLVENPMRSHRAADSIIAQLL